jgi:starch phosphorylase
MEASGTSGMKAAINGVLNCSILDGWWDEAWEKDVGFAIGHGETYANYDYQDQVESEALYDLLEKQVVPMFYDRDADGHPTAWIASMKKCLQSIGPVYNTNRMVQEYAEKYYLPAHHHNVNVMANELEVAKEHARYVRHLREHWKDVSVEEIEAATSRPLGVRQPMTIQADVRLGRIYPSGVAVQVFYGLLDSQGRIVEGRTANMEHVEDLGDSLHRYRGEISAPNSGRHGFAIRVLPGREDLASPIIPGLMTWDFEEPEPVETEEQEVTVDA